MVNTTSGVTRRIWLQLIVVTLAAASTAGCGVGGRGGGEASSPTPSGAAQESAPPTATPGTTEPPTISFDDASAAYEACLTANGTSTADFPSGESMEDLAELADASAATLAELQYDEAFIRGHAVCWPAFAGAIAAGATPPPAAPSSPPIDTELAAKLHAAVECLNERGWDFLEPGVETGALTMAPRQADFTWDPASLKDQQECQELAGMMG